MVKAVVRTSVASLVVLVAASAPLRAQSAARVTYTKDVAPILFNKCVACHRPGEVAPMSLLTYKDARPWARAIKAKVASREMPPWHADRSVNTFANDPSLTDQQIATIAAWVDQGAPEGDARDLPAAPTFADGWTIPAPDVVFSMPEAFEVPAQGTIDYKNFIVPTNFTEDKWIEAAEIRPGARSVVHHVIVYVVEPTRTVPTTQEERQIAATGGSFLAAAAPGWPGMVLKPGQGKLVKAGSSLRFQMHYTTTGEPTKDKTVIGLRFARNPVREKVVITGAVAADFVIPPNAPHHEVKSSFEVSRDILLISAEPHMHLRGKDAKYTLVYPDGTTKPLLQVKYDFNWQLNYHFAEPLRVPKGSRIDVVMHFDNSTANKYNPDPNQTVRWGDQSWEEMSIGWFEYTVPVDPAPAAPTAGQQD
jgi:hypothetical protein